MLKLALFFAFAVFYINGYLVDGPLGGVMVLFFSVLLWLMVWAGIFMCIIAGINNLLQRVGLIKKRLPGNNRTNTLD